MTTASVSTFRRLGRALWACVVLAALLAAVTGPASEVETPFQPRTAMAMGTELECPQADLTQPGAICPDRTEAAGAPAGDAQGVLSEPVGAPPPAPPLRPPRA